MNYSVRVIPRFERNLKKLVKKYPSLKSEFIQLIKSLKVEPNQGTSLGNSCYKIRLTIASKSKGKRGGARVITNYVASEYAVFLLTIYDKSDRDTLSNQELKELLKAVPK